MFDERQSRESYGLFRRADREEDPSLAAMTDMVFQLLIVFILGVASQVAVLQLFDLDSSVAKGKGVPLPTKEVMLQVFYCPGPAGEDLFQVKVISRPAIDDLVMEDREIEGVDSLVEYIVQWQDENRQIIEKRDDYVLKYTFFSPNSISYENMLTVFSEIQYHIPLQQWLAGMYNIEHLESGSL